MYNRGTELRHIRANDVYKLGVILDDNNCWKKLMEIIPKELNVQESSADGALNWEQAVTKGFKYNNDHIRLMENAIKRSGESRLFSQILFDEWGTSGRKNERPTLGILLQLLVKAELYRAADYVAINYLNEPPPERPLNGPAAAFDISLSSDIFNDIENLVNDSAVYPSTEALNDNANYGDSLADNNKDFYTKYQRTDKEVMINNVAPVPPPRVQRTARLLFQQQQRDQQQQIHQRNEAATVEATGTSRNTISDLNLPKFSQLITQHDDTETTSNTNSNNASQIDSLPNTDSTNLSEAPIPLISVLGESATAAQTEDTSNIQSEYTPGSSDLILPVISALNLNGEHNDELQKPEDFTIASPTQCQNNQSDGDNSSIYILPESLEKIMEDISEDQQFTDNGYDKNPQNDNSDKDDDDDNDDDEDSSVPNLSIFEQRSSNNDSSLTNVTGTSGENSFELSMNDCNSTSNENIPCLSALK